MKKLKIINFSLVKGISSKGWFFLLKKFSENYKIYLLF